MAIIQCPGCGANISDKALKCPKCGRKNIQAETNLCYECGKPLPQKAHSCTFCGASVTNNPVSKKNVADIPKMLSQTSAGTVSNGAGKLERIIHIPQQSSSVLQQKEAVSSVAVKEESETAVVAPVKPEKCESIGETEEISSQPKAQTPQTSEKENGLKTSDYSSKQKNNKGNGGRRRMPLILSVLLLAAACAVLCFAFLPSGSEGTAPAEPVVANVAVNAEQPSDESFAVVNASEQEEFIVAEQPRAVSESAAEVMNDTISNDVLAAERNAFVNIINNICHSLNERGSGYQIPYSPELKSLLDEASNIVKFWVEKVGGYDDFVDEQHYIDWITAQDYETLTYEITRYERTSDTSVNVHIQFIDSYFGGIYSHIIEFLSTGGDWAINDVKSAGSSQKEMIAGFVERHKDKLSQTPAN